MLEIQNLSKNYKKIVALKEVNLSAQPGEITVLLGPNGAGKSTMMKCIIGVLRYQGEILVAGEVNKTPAARRLYGYVPETPALYNLLTLDEHLEFISRAYGVSDYKERMEPVIERFGMVEYREKTAREMSKGMKQKVSICCALLPQPKLVLFDEPMIGLDPAAIREVKKLFVQLRDTGVSVVISTHIIDSISELWDSAYILDHGQIKEVVKRAELKATKLELEDLFFRVTGETE